jgi:hypothetical protein
MAGLRYREDMDEVRARLTTWWAGGDIGRPALHVHVPREHPWEEIPTLPEPPGWTGPYSTADFAYRVNLAQRTCLGTTYLAEAVPFVAPDLAPNCLALFLGCQGVEMPGTVWCEPFIKDPDDVRLAVDPRNRYWDFVLRLTREQLRLGEGRFLCQFPDLIEALDTLAAMRGTAELLVDLIERPEWVHGMLRQLTELYFEYYDPLYELMRDETGGSVFWAWAPGRMAKLQCDFSAMIGKTMFDEFELPHLREMTERLDHSMYHLDGPGALVHVESLVSMPRLDMIQWTSGSGAEEIHGRKWWPMFHQVLDAGKALFVASNPSDEDLLALRQEFGDGLKRFLISLWRGTEAEAERSIPLVTF